MIYKYLMGRMIPMPEKMYDLIIIGSGPAGLTAAIYASRARIKTLVLAGYQAGGQLMLTTDVEDYPGFPEGVQGPELIALMRKQGERFGAEFINEDVTSTDFSKQPFTVKTDSGTFKTRSVIVATGASAKWLEIESEKRLIGRGVSSCAVCDAAFFKEKVVAVIGGGDSAMREALHLSKYASSVTIIHRRDEFRAFPILKERVLANPKIKVVWNSEVQEVLGKDRVEGVKIKDVKTGKTQVLNVQGMFVAIGHTPNTNFLKGQIELDQKGYIIVKNEVLTSKSNIGIFAAGDVHDPKYMQAVTAAGAGCKAALEVEDFLELMKHKGKK